MTLITEKNFDRSLELISQCERVAIDTETYWTSSWEKKRIIGVSIYGEFDGKHIGCYYPFRHEDETGSNLCLDALRDVTKILNDVPRQTFHNAKFDRQRFILEGLELTQPFACTMVMSHMDDENGSHVLEDLAEKFGIDPVANLRKQHLHNLRESIVWHKIPLHLMSEYACGDARNTFKLYDKLHQRLKKQELDSLWADEEIYSDALMHMELNGVLIDPKLAEEYSYSALMRMIEIKKELKFDCAKELPLATKLFKELGLPIYERGKPAKAFPEGRPTMNAAVFQRLQKEAGGEAAEVMKLIMEFRGLRQARSFWYEGWPELMGSDYRLHSTFHQHGTVTSRLASIKPNMQQIPRDLEKTPVKKLLRATKGYQLWSYDYSQIEYRLAGVLSNDPIILGAYRAGSDMHQLTANRLGFSRQDSKTVNFLFIYEGGPGRYGDVFGVPMDISKQVWVDYHDVYSVMFKYAARVNATAAQRGYIKYWDGRRRHFKFHFECKKAWNSLVQGGAGRIMQKGIINLHQDKELMKEIRLVNAVHDDVWIEIPDDLVNVLDSRVRHHLEWASRDKRFKIPFPVDGKRLA